MQYRFNETSPGAKGVNNNGGTQENFAQLHHRWYRDGSWYEIIFNFKRSNS